ncbi:SDR family NAD(P)-dependent oxidoreductase [uncultured Cellulomonas sp.]|uniref:type I polyketide synthase n=1 Tax=uncultured Cellulomonas sp. TaxID=189682 RepID=UPI0028EDF55F|nr:SDR family NAD(P)-dependent oxidoreductase [uncultured Cellulomonas sp.]
MDTSVAVVGLAARLPGSRDAGELWEHLVAGVDGITHFTQAELDAAGVPSEVSTHPDFIAAEPRVADVDQFDAGLFGMTPREAHQADPQMRLFVESCHAALEDAGVDPFRVPGKVAVFGAAGMPIYLFEHLMPQVDPSNQGQLSMLNNGDYFATQVAFRLNLTGPALTVLTACSSSLTAVQLAVQSLSTGQCDVALAGGANVELDARFGYFYAPGSVRSSDGRCRPFDASGGGTVFGSGAGAVVLRRLEDAVADGDHVYCVIRGAAINNDGKVKEGGFGAPSVDGQADCIRSAMRDAGVLPSQIAYVEAHATGTRVGDPIELAALAAAWDSLEPGPRTAPPSAIGSIKSNIGHVVQAAGVAGLIKIALALDREVIPPSINVDTVMPELTTVDSPFRLATAAEPWPRTPDAPRRGAISSFGAGGTNVHLVVEEGPVAAATPLSGRERLVLWSARSAAAADELAGPLADHLATTARYEDSVTTLQRGRSVFRHRRAVVLQGPEHAATALAGELPARPVAAGRAGAVPPAVVLAFSGQGALSPGAGLDLYATDTRFAAHVDCAFALCGPAGDRARSVWQDATAGARLLDTDVAQVVLFALELALARTMTDCGVTVSAVTGHSLGELVAATFAGVLAPVDAAKVVVARASAMQAMERGSMAAVLAAEATTRDLMPDTLDIAAVNGERETVVSGPDDEVARFLAELRGHGVRTTLLRTSHAFHSRAMAGACEPLLAAFEGVTLRPPTLTLISAAAGRAVVNEATRPEFWVDQLTQPVRFADAVDALGGLAQSTQKRRDVVVVEVGPGQVLTGLVAGRTAGRDDGVFAVPALPRQRAGDGPGERRDLLGALGRAWTLGVDLDVRALDADAPSRRVPVPGYRYEREQFWVDTPPWRARAPLSGAADPAPVDASAAPAIHPVVSTPYSAIRWNDVDRPQSRRRSSLTVALLPADRDLARRLLVALQQTSDRVVAVRPGPSYEAAARGTTLDATEPAQLARLLADSLAAGQVPDRVVHATTCDGWEDLAVANVRAQQRASFDSVLQLHQELARAPMPAPELLVLTSRSVDVSGAETIDPVKATLHGLVRTLALEARSGRTRLVDVDGGVAEDDLVDELAADGVDEPVVALRGPRRWVPSEQPLDVEARGTTVLRRRGVYLVTGGLGGLGAELVVGLARTGLQPRIAVVGRRALPETPSRAHAAIEEATELGAEVRVLTGDIGDERDVQRILDIVAARWSSIDGVFHLAGLPGGGVAALRDLEAARAVLHPKVTGTTVLVDALRNRRAPEFWVSFASRAGVTGLAGSADYAAANAFLDAVAGSPPLHDMRMVSVDWPSWRDVGMAVPGLAALTQEATGTTTYTEELSPSATWALDEHRLEGVPVLPGAAQVDLVVRAFRAVLGPGEGPLQLMDVAFTAALVAHEPTCVEVTFTPTGHAWRVQVRSRPAPSADPAAWRTHSSGTIQHAGEDATLGRVDLAPLRERLTGHAVADRVQDASRSFVLGPRWDAISAEHHSDELTLVDIALAAPFAADLEVHPLHPALLDCATAAARDVAAGAFVPFMYGSVRVGRTLPGRFTSVVRRTRTSAEVISADIDLVLPDGSVAVAIRDFVMRRFDAEGFMTRSDAGAAPTGPAATAVGPGILPTVGVDLTLRLLSARTPRQVVVRPFVDGLPVPLRVGLPAAGPATALVAPDLADVPTAGPGDAEEPTATANERMRAVWLAVLGSVDLDDDDDFFDVGGTSLSAIELVARIRDEFGTAPSIADLLDFPTLAGLAAKVV